MANTPAPIFNHRKRPRQSLIADPQHSLITHPVPGPSGAATTILNDLMPPGGFVDTNSKVEQRNTTPQFGQGAAFFSRHSYSSNIQGNQHAGLGGTNNGGASYRKQSSNWNNSFNNDASAQAGMQNQTLRQSQTGQSLQGRGQWVAKSTGFYQQSNRYQNQANRSEKQRYEMQNPGKNQTNQIKSGQWNSNRTNQQRLINSKLPGNQNRNSMYWQSGNGMNSKMVPTSSSGHVDNRHKDTYRSFNNNSTNQATSVQYRFKPSQRETSNDTTEMEEWDSSFDENFSGQNKNNLKQTKTIAVKSKQSQQDTGLHLLTVNVAGMKRWSKFKDTIVILFEMFGVLDSAITKSSVDSKEFLMRDEEKNSVKCVFFEIDRPIPKMTRGLMYRVVGIYDRVKDLMKCSSVRSTCDGERNLGTKLVEICAKTMAWETRHLREM